MQSVAPHVLALDDDPEVRAMLVEYLGSHDLRITAVATGREMLSFLENEPVDVLLLDLRLPGEDGLALARQVRNLSAVPIIILTGRTDEADRLARELLDFEIRVTEDANERYGAFRVGSQDDLVTALGLATQKEPSVSVYPGRVSYAL